MCVASKGRGPCAWMIGVVLLAAACSDDPSRPRDGGSDAGGDGSMPGASDGGGRDSGPRMMTDSGTKDAGRDGGPIIDAGPDTGGDVDARIEEDASVAPPPEAPGRGEPCAEGDNPCAEGLVCRPS